jgi:hypothetical protein
MTTMGFAPYDGQNVRTVHLPALASTGTFVAGDAVYLNAGLVTVAASGTVIGSIFGVAAADNDVASAVIPVYVADTTSLWVGECDTTTANSQVGENYGLNITTGEMSIDVAQTTTTLVRIIDLHPADGVKAKGRMLFNWKATALQGNGLAD